MSAWDAAGGRQTAVVVITAIDAPRMCHTRRKLLFASAERSSRPQKSPGFCGMIYTDHGTIELPESNVIFRASSAREAMWDNLTVGCRYAITVAGFGRDLKPGDGGASHGNKRLVSLKAQTDCGQSKTM